MLASLPKRVIFVVPTLLLVLFITTSWRNSQYGIQTLAPRLRSRIAKVTVAVNDLNTTAVRRCLRSHEVQNEMHGYQYIIGDTAVFAERDDQERPLGAWSKPAYLLKVLLEELSKPAGAQLEWLFWSDADTLILDPHIKLETFLPPQDSTAASQVQLLITSNMDGINNGVFLLRVHAWSVGLLTAMLAYQTYHPNIWLGQRDQSAMAEILDNNAEFRHNWTVVPTRWFNSLPFNYGFSPNGTFLLSFPMAPDTFDNGEPRLADGSAAHPWKVQKGDMLVHFAGVVPRSTWIEPWADRAELYSPEWSSPAFQSRLEVEASRFWEAWKEDAGEGARLAAMNTRGAKDVHLIHPEVE